MTPATEQESIHTLIVDEVKHGGSDSFAKFVFTVIVLCPIKHATILTPIRRCKSVFLTPYIDKLNLSDKEKEF